MNLIPQVMSDLCGSLMLCQHLPHIHYTTRNLWVVVRGNEAYIIVPFQILLFMFNSHVNAYLEGETYYVYNIYIGLSIFIYPQVSSALW